MGRSQIIGVFATLAVLAITLLPATIFGGQEDREFLFQLGWSVTLICALISAWVAGFFLQEHPRLDPAFALLACAWMLVLAGYVAPGDTVTPAVRKIAYLASDIAAVLFVYIGGLLAAQGQETRTHPVGIAFAQKVALGLLFFVAIPPSITFPGPLGTCYSGSWVLLVLNRLASSAARKRGLTIAGFYSLWRGAQHIAPQLSSVLALVLIWYTVPSLARTYELWGGYVRSEPITLFWFTGAKLALTVVLKPEQL